MAARNQQEQVEQGLLSPSIAALLAKRNRASIRNWARDGTLKPYRFRQKGEVRVSALELMRHMINLRWPFAKELAIAAYNFAKSAEYSSVEYCKEILRTYEKTSPEDRVNIPFVPNPPETVDWDDSGDIRDSQPPTKKTDGEQHTTLRPKR